MSETRQPLTYAAAGVDTAKANAALTAMMVHFRQTHNQYMLDADGQPFAAPMALGRMLKDLRIWPDQAVLSATVDSAGTIPQEAVLALDFFPEGMVNTAYNVAAHCCADIACGGLTPFMFLDMITSTDMNPAINELISQGITDACLELDPPVMVVGGELAQCPGTMAEGQYDIIGFAIGMGDEVWRIKPTERVKPGHVIVGYKVGFHMINGSSLIRRVLKVAGLGIKDIFPPTGKTVAESLLQRQPNWAKMVMAQMNAGIKLSANSHITGGGMPDNISRNLPEGCRAVIDLSNWKVPDFFTWLMETGPVEPQEAFAKFNMGIGFVQIMPRMEADRATLMIADPMGFTPYHLGEIVEGERGVEFI